MEERVKKDILVVLQDLKKGILKNNLDVLKSSSDKTLHDAGLYQDEDSITVAVVAYSLYKIFSRERLQNNVVFEKFKNRLFNEITEARNILIKGDFSGYRKEMKDVLALIGKLEKKFGMYITEVLSQARIKKGGRVYEHGISSGRAAELMGISPWELQTYLGATKLSEVSGATGIEERLKKARRIFLL